MGHAQKEMDLLLAGVLQDTWEEDARTVSISGPCDFAKFLPVSSITENLPMVAGLAWMGTVICASSLCLPFAHTFVSIVGTLNFENGHFGR